VLGEFVKVKLWRRFLEVSSIFKGKTLEVVSRSYGHCKCKTLELVRRR
jgi:hypothetical protein